MDPQSNPQASGEPGAPMERPWGKFSLLVKLNLTIGLSFLLTMIVFAFLGYRAEKNFQVDHSTRLLRSTLEILAGEIEAEGGGAGVRRIDALQARIDATGVHHHLIFLVDPANRVIAAANPEQQGRLLSELFSEPQTELRPENGTLVTDGRARWLRVGRAVSGGRTLYLFLDWGHVAWNLRAFWALHGAHFLATVALFSFLLWLVTVRFIRLPLLALVVAIKRIEMGQWKPELETRSRDEFGWLCGKFKEMAQRLKENVDRLVRVEKYASAAIIVIRVARELREPLASMRRNLNDLSAAGRKDLSIAVITADLDRGLLEIDRSLKGLAEIQHPDEWDVMAPANGDQDDHRRSR